jgi:hypothetical protein
VNNPGCIEIPQNSTETMNRIPRLIPVLTLVAFIGSGGPPFSTTSRLSGALSAVNAAEPAAAPKAGSKNEWKAPKEAAAKLGNAVKILGGRFSVHAPAGFKSEADKNDHAFRKGELELGFVRGTGYPRDVILADYAKTMRDVEGAGAALKNAEMGEVESGKINGRPFCRFRYTYTDAKKKELAGFGYATADGTGTFIYMSARGDPQELEVLEACVLSFKK